MIRCDRLSVKRSGRLVIDDVSLAVDAGESLAIIGHCGSGKSSLLATLATAVPIESGDALVDGASTRHEPEATRRLIGYVPSHLTAWPGVRADEFLELFATSAGLRGKPMRAAIDAALVTAGMRGRGGDRIDHLSDGDAKRLLLARALVHGPRILLLDDPLGGLDPAGRGLVERLIEEATVMGRTVVAAMDDGCVPDCFTRVAVLRAGRIIGQGPVDPAHFAADGRSWTFRIHCRGRAESAAEAARPLVAWVRAAGPSAVDCAVDPSRLPFSEVVAAVVRAGVDVESAGFHPPWTVQLLEPAER